MTAAHLTARRLLLVHGFGGSREDFTEWLPRLAAIGWEAEALQLPGHGSMAPPYSLADFAGFVLQFAGSLGWDRFVLLGHSMGGFVAQLVALRAADGLDALILMDTAHAVPDGIDLGMVELGKKVVREGGLAALVEAQRGLPPDTEAHARLLRERPGYAEFMERRALAMDPDMWLTMVDEMVAQPDRLEALRSVEVPTLVMVGEQDGGYVGPSRRMASALPNGRLAVIADAGHSPQFEAPEEWWSVLTSFLEEIA
jgi:pimeloyl-ACP methyl ester carboxylesterase